MKAKTLLQLEAERNAYQTVVGWLDNRRRRHIGGSRSDSTEAYKCWVLDKIILQVSTKVADLKLDINEAREIEDEKHTHK